MSRRLWEIPNVDFIPHPIVDQMTVKEAVAQIADSFKRQFFFDGGPRGRGPGFYLQNLASNRFAPATLRLTQHPRDALSALPEDNPARDCHWYHANGVRAVRGYARIFMDALADTLEREGLAHPDVWIGDAEATPSVQNALWQVQYSMDGSWDEMIADGRATNEDVKPCRVIVEGEPPTILSKTVDEMVQGPLMPLPDDTGQPWTYPENRPFTKAWQSQAITATSFAYAASIREAVREFFPECEVTEYECYATAPDLAFVEGSGSQPWLEYKPPAIGLDRCAPVCYSVKTLVYRLDENETPIETQVRVFSNRVQACQGNAQGKPVMPWIQAPGQEYEEYMMDGATFLAMLEEARSLGIEHIVIWAGTNMWDWSALLNAITAFNEGNP